MSRKDGRVSLPVYVEPVLRDYAREAARLAGLSLSDWVARAVRQAVGRESVARVTADAATATAALDKLAEVKR